MAQRGFRNEALLEVQEWNMFQVPSYPMCRSISVPWPRRIFSDCPSIWLRYFFMTIFRNQGFLNLMCLNRHLGRLHQIFSTGHWYLHCLYLVPISVLFMIYGYHTKWCSEHICWWGKGKSISTRCASWRDFKWRWCGIVSCTHYIWGSSSGLTLVQCWHSCITMFVVPWDRFSMFSRNHFSFERDANVVWLKLNLTGKIQKSDI